MKEIGAIAMLILELVKLGKQLFYKSEKEKRHDKLVESHEAIKKAKSGDMSDLDRLLNGH